MYIYIYIFASRNIAYTVKIAHFKNTNCKFESLSCVSSAFYLSIWRLMSRIFDFELSHIRSVFILCCGLLSKYVDWHHDAKYITCCAGQKKKKPNLFMLRSCCVGRSVWTPLTLGVLFRHISTFLSSLTLEYFCPTC